MKEVNLHLGCGKRYLPGYVHIDLDSHSHIDHYHDVRELPMFDDESVDLIYNCGTFEYFDRHKAPSILREWSRALKIGGTLRMSVPDFDSIVEVYLQNGKNLNGEGMLGPLFGRIDIKTNNGLQTMHHKTVYDFESFKAMLLEAGFVNVQKYDWWSVLPKEYDDYSMAYIPYKNRDGIQMSLNIECVKGIN